MTLFFYFGISSKILPTTYSLMIYNVSLYLFLTSIYSSAEHSTSISRNGSRYDIRGLELVFYNGLSYGQTVLCAGREVSGGTLAFLKV